MLRATVTPVGFGPSSTPVVPFVQSQPPSPSILYCLSSINVRFFDHLSPPIPWSRSCTPLTPSHHSDCPRHPASTLQLSVVSSNWVMSTLNISSIFLFFLTFATEPAFCMVPVCNPCVLTRLLTTLLGELAESTHKIEPSCHAQRQSQRYALYGLSPRWTPMPSLPCWIFSSRLQQLELPPDFYVWPHSVQNHLLERSYIRNLRKLMSFQVEILHRKHRLPSRPASFHFSCDRSGRHQLATFPCM